MHARCTAPIWLVRISVGSVFLLNMTCARQFVIWPQHYAGSFELGGVVGAAMVRSIGLLFLMWSITYLPVLLRPDRQPVPLIVVLVQQAIGLAGETWMWMALPDGHAQLRATGLRFILFDGAGLILMSLSAGLLLACVRRTRGVAASRMDACHEMSKAEHRQPS